MKLLVVMLLASLASLATQAQTQAPGPWHAVVVPPRISFPTVTVDLGYRGPYIPTDSTPITLHATAGDLPFNGYIGFHYQVQDHLTYDTPVIARAVLRPHESWTFSTFATMQRYASVRGEGPGKTVFVPRQLVIEWRGPSMRVAARQRTGVPPWTTWIEGQMPLRIAGPATALGREAHAEEPNALSDRAQWYAGFSDLVTPLDVWIDLPKRVREAIFGSGIHIVFHGFPRSNQQLDEIGRALLPITFVARPGSYQAPWPYPASGPVTTPMSWIAKSETYGIGGAAMPYMVRSNAATWVADEAGVSRPLPAVRATPTWLFTALQHRRKSHLHMSRELPRPSHFLRIYPAATLSIAAAIVALAGWILFRRRPRLVTAVALLAIAGVVFAARDRIRPGSGGYNAEIQRSVAPGIVSTVHAKNVYGPTSLPADDGDEETMRTSITSAASEIENAEVRTSETAVSMGMMRRHWYWDTISRFRMRSEADNRTTIHIARREGNTLVLDYEAPFAVSEVTAQWICGDAKCYGETTVRPGTSGRATINDGHEIWPEEEPFLWYAPRTAAWNRPGAAWVTLVHRDRAHMRMFEWLEAVPQEPGSYVIADRAKGLYTFALPVTGHAPAEVVVDIPESSTSQNVMLAWAGGSTPLTPTGRNGTAFQTHEYAVPLAAIRAALANGGIVVVSTGDEHLSTVSIKVWEKKP